MPISGSLRITARANTLVYAETMMMMIIGDKGEGRLIVVYSSPRYDGKELLHRARSCCRRDSDRGCKTTPPAL